MSMRKQFVATVSERLAADGRVVLLLGDIGVYGFQDAAERFPDRVYNIGILEQATVSLAAGLAKTGLIPIVHTIAPFLTERCLEQIKIDFGYQGLAGNFVTVGASYDYAALGCTHHCPGDVQAVTTIPGVEVIVPGNASEFDRLFSETYDSAQPTYFRLAEQEHPAETTASFGQGSVLQEGQAATIVVVGPLLASVLEAVRNLDVTLLYYHTVRPFDGELLRRHAASGKVLLCEPYYRGGLAAEITEALWPKPVLLRSLGVPRRFLTAYGKVEEHDAAIGLTPEAIRGAVEELIRV